MRANFDKAFEIVIESEGGYSDDPDDPGGRTNYGISQKAYPNLDIKNLTLDQAKAIYLQDYWLKSGCDNLAAPLDIVVFDTAVNQGVSRALAFLKVADNWQDYLLRRIAHYKGLKKDKYFKGWVNRVVNLYEAVK